MSGAQTLESIFWPLKPGPRPCCNRTVRTGDFPCWMHTFWSLVLQQEDQQKHLAAEGFYFYTSIQVKIFKYPNSPQRISLHLVLDLLVKIYLKKKKKRKKKYKTPPPNTIPVRPRSPRWYISQNWFPSAWLPLWLPSPTQKALTENQRPHCFLQNPCWENKPHLYYCFNPATWNSIDFFHLRMGTHLLNQWHEHWDQISNAPKLPASCTDSDLLCICSLCLSVSPAGLCTGRPSACALHHSCWLWRCSDALERLCTSTAMLVCFDACLSQQFCHWALHRQTWLTYSWMNVAPLGCVTLVGCHSPIDHHTAAN